MWTARACQLSTGHQDLPCIIFDSFDRRRCSSFGCVAGFRPFIKGDLPKSLSRHGASRSSGLWLKEEARSRLQEPHSRPTAGTLSSKFTMILYKVESGAFQERMDGPTVKAPRHLDAQGRTVKPPASAYTHPHYVHTARLAKARTSLAQAQLDSIVKSYTTKTIHGPVVPLHLVAARERSTGLLRLRGMTYKRSARAADVAQAAQGHFHVSEVVWLALARDHKGLQATLNNPSHVDSILKEGFPMDLSLLGKVTNGHESWVSRRDVCSNDSMAPAETFIAQESLEAVRPEIPRHAAAAHGHAYQAPTMMAPELPHTAPLPRDHVPCTAPVPLTAGNLPLQTSTDGDADPVVEGPLTGTAMTPALTLHGQATPSGQGMQAPSCEAEVQGSIMSSSGSIVGGNTSSAESSEVVHPPSPGANSETDAAAPSTPQAWPLTVADLTASRANLMSELQDASATGRYADGGSCTPSGPTPAECLQCSRLQVASGIEALAKAEAGVQRRTEALKEKDLDLVATQEALEESVWETVKQSSDLKLQLSAAERKHSALQEQLTGVEEQLAAALSQLAALQASSTQHLTAEQGRRWASEQLAASEKDRLALSNSLSATNAMVVDLNAELAAVQESRIQSDGALKTSREECQGLLEQVANLQVRGELDRAELRACLEAKAAAEQASSHEIESLRQDKAALTERLRLLELRSEEPAAVTLSIVIRGKAPDNLVTSEEHGRAPSNDNSNDDISASAAAAAAGPAQQVFVGSTAREEGSAARVSLNRAEHPAMTPQCVVTPIPPEELSKTPDEQCTEAPVLKCQLEKTIGKAGKAVLSEVKQGQHQGSASSDGGLQEPSHLSKQSIALEAHQDSESQRADPQAVAPQAQDAGCQTEACDGSPVAEDLQWQVGRLTSWEYQGMSQARARRSRAELIRAVGLAVEAPAAVQPQAEGAVQPLPAHEVLQDTLAVAQEAEAAVDALSLQVADLKGQLRTVSACEVERLRGEKEALREHLRQTECDFQAQMREASQTNQREANAQKEGLHRRLIQAEQQLKDVLDSLAAPGQGTGTQKLQFYLTLQQQLSASRQQHAEAVQEAACLEHCLRYLAGNKNDIAVGEDTSVEGVTPSKRERADKVQAASFAPGNDLHHAQPCADKSNSNGPFERGRSPVSDGLIGAFRPTHDPTSDLHSGLADNSVMEPSAPAGITKTPVMGHTEAQLLAKIAAVLQHRRSAPLGHVPQDSKIEERHTPQQDPLQGVLLAH
ncbi:hypothetical protein WJX73_000172 [Symbiochloris irregularis]|uniref:Uncharacterized protein n=1 Tax=Symbiochloris irregularis TaxID=706552 RepID=A0AAW1PQN3_9CHLO